MLKLLLILCVDDSLRGETERRIGVAAVAVFWIVSSVFRSLRRDLRFLFVGGRLDIVGDLEGRGS